MAGLLLLSRPPLPVVSSIWLSPDPATLWSMLSYQQLPLLMEGDEVEYKCLSSRGVSPWLECVVQGVTDSGLYDLGESVRTEVKRYVPREALRFVRREYLKPSRLKRLQSRVASSCTVM